VRGRLHRPHMVTAHRGACNSLTTLSAALNRFEALQCRAPLTVFGAGREPSK
jgi:hypothetical protein